jgi:hypothetical protein
LKTILGDDLVESCWTNELRSAADVGLPKWRPENPNATYCDFTVLGVGNRLAHWLVAKGINFGGGWAQPRTYHVEVKTTAGVVREPFHISHLQKQFCEGIRSKPDEMFLIFRVYDVDGRDRDPLVVPDPWLKAGL